MLLAWNGVLLALALHRGRRFTLDVVLRRQHWLQVCVQLSIFAYWGWYWRTVYDSVALIASQVIFAYAFDALLSYSRRDQYTLGFGPVPIILSANLFLWFKPDWFYLQFVMMGVGLLVRELVRWRRDGRLTHIFNPSSFPLAICSLVLIFTDSGDLTWGTESPTPSGTRRSSSSSSSSSRCRVSSSSASPA